MPSPIFLPPPFESCKVKAESWRVQAHQPLLSACDGKWKYLDKLWHGGQLCLQTGDLASPHIKSPPLFIQHFLHSSSCLSSSWRHYLMFHFGLFTLINMVKSIMDYFCAVIPPSPGWGKNISDRGIGGWEWELVSHTSHAGAGWPSLDPLPPFLSTKR